MIHLTDLVNKVKDIIAAGLCVPKNNIHPDDKFDTDFGADELDLIELCMDIEAEFGLSIPEDDAEKLVTLRECVKYLSGRLEMKFDIDEYFQNAKDSDIEVSEVALTSWHIFDFKYVLIHNPFNHLICKPRKAFTVIFQNEKYRVVSTNAETTIDEIKELIKRTNLEEIK